MMVMETMTQLETVPRGTNRRVNEMPELKTKNTHTALLNVDVVGGAWTIEGKWLRIALLFHARATQAIAEEDENDKETMKYMFLAEEICKTQWHEWTRLLDFADKMGVSVTLDPSLKEESLQAAEQAAS